MLGLSINGMKALDISARVDIILGERERYGVGILFPGVARDARDEGEKVGRK